MIRLILVFLLLPAVVFAAGAYVEFDPPLDPSDLTTVLVSGTPGDYSHATGQRSYIGVGHVEMQGVNPNVRQYFVAYRYNPETEEQSEYSAEMEYIPTIAPAAEIAPGTCWFAEWDYPDIVISGFRLYAGGVLVWEGNDPTARSAEFICTLYGEPVGFQVTAYKPTAEAVKSVPCCVVPALPVGNVFQMLPWDARVRLCQAVRPQGGVCWACHANY